MTKTSNQIKKILALANDNIDKILEYIGLEYDLEDKEFRCECPIHDGDNPTAFKFFRETGTWCCFTNQCHTQYKNNAFGLLEGFIKKENPQASFRDIVDKITEIVGISLDDVPDLVEKSKEEKFVTSTVKSISKTRKPEPKPKSKFSVPVDIARKTFKPSQYYLDEGFSEEILNQYLVQDCHDMTKPMYNRAVFPVFDLSGENIIGASGRTLLPHCKHCDTYHKEGMSNCHKKQYSKWKHWGFHSSEVIYNWNIAQEKVQETGCLFLVEGPKDILKFVDNGISNVTCLFGLNISQFHIKEFSRSGVRNIISCLDNDNAGNNAFNNLKKSLSLYFNFKNFSDILEFGQDFAELSDDIFKEKLVTKAREYNYV